MHNRATFLKLGTTALASGLFVPQMELVPEDVKRFWSLQIPKGIEACTPCQNVVKLIDVTKIKEFLDGHIDIRPHLHEEEFAKLNEPIGLMEDGESLDVQTVLSAADNSRLHRGIRVFSLAKAGHEFPHDKWEEARTSVVDSIGGDDCTCGVGNDRHAWMLHHEGCPRFPKRTEH